MFTRNALYLMFLVASLFSVSGRAQEIEPNNTCQTAQAVPSAGLPLSVFGSLDAAAPDVDFFRFAAAPGEALVAELRGARTGDGTLPDPRLGLFDSACTLIDVDPGLVFVLRIVFVVPADGVFTLAVTSIPDVDFLGASQSGSYTLTISPLMAIGSISGQLIDADTFLGLRGDAPPFAAVELHRCTVPTCRFFDRVAEETADAQGFFELVADFAGIPLEVGTYRIAAFASGYEVTTTAPFAVAEGEALNLGAIALARQRFIGSIRGRLVDADTGAPLAGFGPPFPGVTLERCDASGCFQASAGAPDDQGFFLFDGVANGLTAGTYRIFAFADDYEPTTTAEFDVAQNENLDIGDVLLTPAQVRLSAVEVCSNPTPGGLCEYRVQVRNRGPGRFRGELWSIVDYFPNAFPFRQTRFQVGRVGAFLPVPVRLHLRAGESIVESFVLFVPTGIPDGSVICATAAVGGQPLAQFASSGDRFLFCVSKQSGNLTLLSEKEGRRELEALRHHGAERAPLRGSTAPARTVPGPSGPTPLGRAPR